MITKQDIQAAASYIFRSSFVSEDQARKAMVKAGNNATKILVKTFRGKLFKKAFERARRGKDISSFERQEKESGFNFLHNPNNGRMQSGHIIIDGIGLFKQIIHESKKVDIRLGRGLANQIKINKTIPVSHKPKEERRMMFVCGDDIASLIKRFENESK